MWLFRKILLSLPVPVPFLFLLPLLCASASPVGIKVWAESEVTCVDGKRIEFKVTAGDEKGLIGEGSHERFVIANERFLAKTAKKLEN